MRRRRLTNLLRQLGVSPPSGSPDAAPDSGPSSEIVPCEAAIALGYQADALRALSPQFAEELGRSADAASAAGKFAVAPMRSIR